MTRTEAGQTGHTGQTGRTGRGISALSKSLHIQELQRLLGVNPDGIFGINPRMRLGNFRRRAGLRVDGPPRHEDLERLRDRR